jgi:hypothetical protein
VRIAELEGEASPSIPEQIDTHGGWRRFLRLVALTRQYENPDLPGGFADHHEGRVVTHLSENSWCAPNFVVVRSRAGQDWHRCLLGCRQSGGVGAGRNSTTTTVAVYHRHLSLGS